MVIFPKRSRCIHTLFSRFGAVFFFTTSSSFVVLNSNEIRYLVEIHHIYFSRNRPIFKFDISLALAFPFSLRFFVCHKTFGVYTYSYTVYIWISMNFEFGKCLLFSQVIHAHTHARTTYKKSKCNQCAQFQNILHVKHLMI